MTVIRQEMTENATHVFIHHYIEYASSLHFGMTCCTVMTAVIVIILVIFLVVVIYVFVTSKRCSRRSRKAATSKSRRRNLMDDASTCNAANNSPRTSTLRNFELEINPQGIPLKTFSKCSKTNDRIGDSSESSAGLYDILFPEQQQEGDIIRRPPNKLVPLTSGQVLPARRSSSNDSNQAGPSAPGLNCDDASGSLDWDYFQQNLTSGRRHDVPLASGIESRVVVVDSDRIRNACWV